MECITASMAKEVSQHADMKGIALKAFLIVPKGEIRHLHRYIDFLSLSHQLSNLSHTAT